MSNKIINNDPCNEKLLLLLLFWLAVQAPDDKVYPSLHAVHLPASLPVPSVLHPKRHFNLEAINKDPVSHVPHLGVAALDSASMFYSFQLQYHKLLLHQEH